jgi:hypothetical protein
MGHPTWGFDRRTSSKIDEVSRRKKTQGLQTAGVESGDEFQETIMAEKVESISIRIPSGSQYEAYIDIKSDGVIRYHGENDGNAFMRGGAQSVDETISVAEARKRCEGRGSSRTVNGKSQNVRTIDELEAALAQLGIEDDGAK